ncbi:MAG: hypothetical protein MH252_03820 [Thermosynechococcaceae cyanobacterium MS004]|nr:hypothetical protein [Thermosynechococcaceae cyanobacterium MS004]
MSHPVAEISSERVDDIPGMARAIDGLSPMHGKEQQLVNVLGCQWQRDCHTIAVVIVAESTRMGKNLKYICRQSI